ncbi:MAG: hypothetical protein JSW66_07145 [Phycisphaerales bacterium]|nr:MAG: hypothetical protein JSW66_07145 [Phycisphaerales bacterium]
MAVARDRQLERPLRRQDGLRARPVAVVGKSRLGLVHQMNVHLGIEHPLGNRLLQLPDQTLRIEDALRITPGQQLVEQLRGKTLVVLGHTSPSPCRAVYGSSHKNPDTPKGDTLVFEVTTAMTVDYGRGSPATTKPYQFTAATTAYEIDEWIDGGHELYGSEVEDAFAKAAGVFAALLKDPPGR